MSCIGTRDVSTWGSWQGINVLKGLLLIYVNCGFVDVTCDRQHSMGHHRQGTQVTIVATSLM